MDLDLFRLTRLQLKVSRRPASDHNTWGLLYKKSKHRLAELISNDYDHPIMDLLKMNEVYSLCKLLTSKPNNYKKIEIILRPIERKIPESRAILHTCSDYFEFNGSSFQIFFICDPNIDSSPIVVLKMVTSPRLGGVEVHARNVHFRVLSCQVDGHSSVESNFHNERTKNLLWKLKGNFGGAVSTSAAIMGPYWESYIFSGPFSTEESSEHIDQWCTDVFQNHLPKSAKEGQDIWDLKVSPSNLQNEERVASQENEGASKEDSLSQIRKKVQEICEADREEASDLVSVETLFETIPIILKVEFSPKDLLLEILISWARRKNDPFQNLFELWNFFEQLLECHSNLQNLRKEFVTFFSKTFKFHIEPALSCICQESFALILSQDSLLISSETTALRALIMWSKLPADKLSVEEVNSFFDKYLMWACLKSSPDKFGKVIGPASALPKVGLSEIEVTVPICFGKTPDAAVPLERHLVKDVFLYRDIELLLPLVRFPFISKEALIAECEKEDIAFLKHLSVGLQLLTEATYVQLTPNKRDLESIQCIDSSLKVCIPGCLKDRFKCAHHCKCEMELNLSRKRPRENSPGTIPDISFNSNFLFSFF